MKTAMEGGKSRQNQTQTNTLETKTIRVKSWRDSLSLIPRTPAIVAIAAGFFMLFFLPNLAASLRSEADDSTTESLQPLLPTSSSEETASELSDSDHSENKSDNKNVPEGSSSSISINMSVSSSSNGNEEPASNPEPTVTVNGQTVDLPSNGRINEVLEDDNSRTRIRGRIDADGDSSIRISTDSDIKTEGD